MLLPVMVITHFNLITGSDDRSTTAANVKCTLISSCHHKTKLISKLPGWTAREMKLVQQGVNFYKSNAE